MPVPPEILAVERPRNTVVQAYGKNRDRYAVRQRTGCVRDRERGRNVPVTGPTVGHIVDGVYVPKEPAAPEPVSQAAADLLDWADAQLCDEAFSDVYDAMLAFWAPADALRAYCIAVLRVCRPGIADRDLKGAYESSALSLLRPGAALSKNSVSKFHRDMGAGCSRIAAFMRSRASAVAPGHHLVVDGTLKQCDSKVNSLSDFSYKSRTKGGRHLSLVYAFDLEEMEPVCSECFPGNMPGCTAYEAFLEDNGIEKGLVVADKGFPANAAAGRFGACPDLHYLNPVKRNSKFAGTHSLREYEGTLPGYPGVTWAKAKAKASGKDKWLYSFRDAARAALEERDWLARAAKGGSYDHAAYEKKRPSFGTVVLESDLDMGPATAYAAYSRRWEIEVVMRYYKSALDLDGTRVHDDRSVIGSEFCDFLASLLTYRLINRFGKAGLLEKSTYGKVMAALRRSKKVRIDGGEWRWVRISPANAKVLEALGLLPAPPKKKRGRPRKEKAAD